jgi:hypothetical protein
MFIRLASAFAALAIIISLVGIARGDDSVFSTIVGPGHIVWDCEKAGECKPVAALISCSESLNNAFFRPFDKEHDTYLEFAFNMKTLANMSHKDGLYQHIVWHIQGEGRDCTVEILSAKLPPADE